MESSLQNLFTNVFDMSLTGTYVILLVLLARFPLKKAPKIFSYGLWGVVFFRLICPYSFSTTFSFLKPVSMLNSKTEPVIANMGLTKQPSADLATAVINSSLPPAVPYASADPIQIVLYIASAVWLIGLLAMVIYSMASYIMLKKKIRTARLVNDNVQECENMQSPFVMGILKPQIYIPSGLSGNERTYILKHEQVHIKRFDYLVKPFAFLVLCIHWFNPLVWLGFILMSRDMEMSCDEKVIKELGSGIKREYSTSLLTMAVKGGLISGSPLAFGESNVKNRIKNVLNYKKPSFWFAVASAVLAVVIGIGLMSNPKIEKTELMTKTQSYLSNRTEYVGNASKVSGIISLLTFPDNVAYDHIELQTGEKPYGLTIYLKIGAGKLEDAMGSDYKLYQKNSLVLFSLIGNADNITYLLSDGSKSNTMLFSRNWANNVSGGDIWQLSGNQSSYEEFLKKLDGGAYALTDSKVQSSLPDFSYGGSDQILKLVYKTETEKNQNMKYNGGFLVVAPRVHGTYEEGNELKVFVTTYTAVYNLNDKLVTESSGGIVPAAITYIKNPDGSYTLKKYEQAKDGSDFSPSIKRFCTMPASGKEIDGLADAILKHYSNYEDILKLNTENLKAHLILNGKIGVNQRTNAGETVPLT